MGTPACSAPVQPTRRVRIIVDSKRIVEYRVCSAELSHRAIIAGILRIVLQEFPIAKGSDTKLAGARRVVRRSLIVAASFNMLPLREQERNVGEKVE